MNPSWHSRLIMALQIELSRIVKLPGARAQPAGEINHSRRHQRRK
jgi:hypothetical protein